MFLHAIFCFMDSTWSLHSWTSSGIHGSANGHIENTLAICWVTTGVHAHFMNFARVGPGVYAKRSFVPSRLQFTFLSVVSLVLTPLTACAFIESLDFENPREPLSFSHAQNPWNALEVQLQSIRYPVYFQHFCGVKQRTIQVRCWVEALKIQNPTRKCFREFASWVQYYPSAPGKLTVWWTGL